MNKKDKKELAEAIYFWRKAYKERESDPAVLKARKSLENAQKRLEKAERQYNSAMEGNRMVVESLLPKIGNSVTAFGIRAKYTKEYLRVTFDSKVLDRIAQENVRFRNLIMPHRKETKVKARINLEVAEPETLLQDIPFKPVLDGVE